jgi:hypothetical protein
MSELDAKIAALLNHEIKGREIAVIYRDKAHTQLHGCWFMEDGIPETPFSPSYDLNQAFELLEGVEWDLWNIKETGECLCSINAGDENGVMDDGQTPTEAICRAFLSYKSQPNRKEPSLNE